MANSEDRLSKVKSKLVVEQPYFGTIATYFTTLLNDDLKSFKSTPETFEYNEDYISSLNDNELAFILTNASMHQILSYEIRQECRTEWLWKLAADYAINSLLINNGLEAPFDINYDRRFDNLSAESIYKILEGEIDEDKHTPEQVSQIEYKSVIDSIILNTEDNIDLEKFLNNKAKLLGDLPLGLDMLMPRISNTQISWREELFDVIEDSIKFDYRLSPPNKKFISLGFALPSLGVSKIKIVVAIDTSGSIDTSVLSKFLSEVEAIMNTFDNFEIDLITADAKVQEHYVLCPGDELNYSVKGGGGTNFENTFNYVDTNISDVKLLLYFTDGIGKYPEIEPIYNTLWVLTSKEVTIPFGRQIYIS